MYKVLVIGCGGSGAKTLSYMMDQLRADLAVYGIEEIPGCWQFLNVDTPVQEETSAVGSVSRQGGAYVSCGVADGRYRTVDEVLTTRVQSRETGGLRHLATWIPRRPKDVSFPVTVGAGQFRGIGRLLILRRLGARPWRRLWRGWPVRRRGRPPSRWRAPFLGWETLRVRRRLPWCWWSRRWPAALARP